MLTPEMIDKIVGRISYPGMSLRVRRDGGELVLQVEVQGSCNVTGAVMDWRGRKWRLSRYMTPSEIVQTAFLAVMTAIEHETRERFRYRGAPIFGPHFNVERLVGLALDPNAEDMRDERGAA